MRQQYKSDIIRQAKPIDNAKLYSIYFLFQDNEIVYIGEGPLSECLELHKRDKVFNKVLCQWAKTKSIAESFAANYVLRFKPKYNYMPKGKEQAEKQKSISTKSTLEEYKDCW